MPPGVVLDLGATAKAAAADLLATRIHEQLGAGVLVSLGGDIATAGRAPAGGWQVLVQDGDHDPVSHVALPAGGALATSSTARRTWERDGRTLHHILDPATGLPAESPWRTVSVAAETCAAANTASTAAVVRGVEGVRWLQAHHLTARLVSTDGGVLLLGGWPAERHPGAA
jgi:thiamine biosynthesis lipoprotein